MTDTKKETLPEAFLLKMSDGSTEEAYNMRNAALYLGVHYNVMQRLVKQGKLQRYKTGVRSDFYALRKDLDTLLTAQPVSPDVEEDE